MNCQARLVRSRTHCFGCEIKRTGMNLAAVVAAAVIFAGDFTASSAHAEIVTFTFGDGPYENGTATAFDTNGAAGNIGSYMLVDGVTLTSVAASAPAFVEGPDDEHNWDGLTPAPSTTNYPGSLGQLGVSNPTIGGTNDSNSFNPQESWTVKFDVPIIFRTLDARRFDSVDTMRVTFGTEIFDFIETDFDSSDNRADPFGTDMVIPADTNITFINSRNYDGLTPLPLIGPGSGNGPPAGDAWGLQGFIVETVTAMGAPGDYNGDDIVDAADYVLWRKNLDGPEDALLNRDLGNSGPINQGDYDYWRAHFGDVASGATLGGTAVIPEPTAAAFCGVALVGVGAFARCRRS